MSRDVFVTAFTPNRRSGSGLRTCGVITALAASRPVAVSYVPFGEAPLAAGLAQTPGVSLHAVQAGGGLPRARTVLGARLRGAPLDLARTASPGLVEAARAAGAADRVIADGPNVAAALLPLARRRPVIYLAHNLESGFRGDATLRRFERRVLREFAESWMATRADMEGARALAGEQLEVRYVPNVVDLARIRSVRSAGGQQVLFVGDFSYGPNRDGLAFLAEDVMPLVWAAEPSARLTLVGRGLDRPPADPRVDARGFVADLEAAYAAADVVAVPLRHGGGSPLKFVEALAHGLPVVATDHAAALLEDGVPGEDFLAAADAEAFAAGLLAAMRGEHAAVGARGRVLAERAYSVTALAELLGEAA